MIGYPLDSEITYDGGVPIYDRAISSAPLRELIKRLFSNGILPDRSNDLKVQYVGSTRVSGEIEGETNTYNVVVNPGFGICNGCLKLQEIYYGLEMDISNTTNPRIDTVVLRLDDNVDVRSCTFDIVQGTEASSPVQPTLTRNNTTWEIGLANLYKPATVSSANPVIVTDTRLNSSRCGVISSISEFDTTSLYDQVQADLAHFQDVNEAEFEEWFANVQGQLSTDVAGNLQVQIGTLPQLTTADKSNLVNAINEVFNKHIPVIPNVEINELTSGMGVGNLNVFPDAWDEIIPLISYEKCGFKVKTSGNSQNEVYNVFAQTPNGPVWVTTSASSQDLTITFPGVIDLSAFWMSCSIRPNKSSQSQIKVYISEDGNTFRQITTLSVSVVYSSSVTVNASCKAIRLQFIPGSGSTTISVMMNRFKLLSFGISQKETKFTLSNVPEMVEGQMVLVKIPDSYIPAGIISNSLNDIPIKSVLQAGRIYELIYHTTGYTAKEVG